jgi:5-formyltetrahydrofolate cyclo-ligase
MKNTLRQQIIQTRKSLVPEYIDTVNERFTQEFINFFDIYRKTHHPKIIGAYVSIHNEINVLPALDYCRSLGYQTALPFCHGKHTDLTYHLFHGDISTLSPDRFNIPAPNPKTDIIIPDLIVCPAVGVCNTTQKRLGYGGGFFDKYAAQHPHIHFISGFCDYQMIDNPDIFMPHDLYFFHILKI